MKLKCEVCGKLDHCCCVGDVIMCNSCRPWSPAMTEGNTMSERITTLECNVRILKMQSDQLHNRFIEIVQALGELKEMVG